MKNKGSLKNFEKKYIQDHCIEMTDRAMAKHLERDIRTVSKYRKELGIEKGRGGKIISANLVDADDSSPSPQLGKKQTVEFYKMQLKSSRYFKVLKNNLNEEELEYYLESWADLSDQFSDIIVTERRQIDELIKAEILGNRLMHKIKILSDEIEELVQEIEKLRADQNFDDDIELQHQDEAKMMLVTRMHGTATMIANDYQKNSELRRKILEDLNGRRKDRADQMKNIGTKFADIILAYKEEKVREVQGRRMELLKMSRDKKMDQWRQVNMFPDGSRECFLLDSESDISIPDHELIKDITDTDLLNNPDDDAVESLEKLGANNA